MTENPDQKYSNVLDCTPPTEVEKQGIGDFLVICNKIFARHKMNFGINTDFKVKLTPKDEKAVYNQNLPMPSHMKENLMVELGLILNYRVATVLRFSSTQVPFFHKENATENYLFLLCMSGK